MNSSKWIASLVLMVFIPLSSFAQAVTGVMMVVKGDVKVTSKEGKTEAAKVGKKVSEGDAVVAGPDSRSKIVMADKNVINISPDSKIIIEKYQNDGKDKKNVELNVVYGKLRASVEQKYDGEKSKFNVKTPSAVAGVRGTDFLTSFNPATKSSQVITFHGTVAVGQPGPGGTIVNPVYVRPGETTQVNQGAAPEPPRALPKEELNQVNTESKADTASNSKSDKTEATASEGKKEDKKEEDKKEASNDQKSEDKKSEDKKADEKKSDEKQADKKSEDKQADKKSEDQRSDKKAEDQPRDKKSESQQADKKADERAPEKKSAENSGPNSSPDKREPVASDRPAPEPGRDPGAAERREEPRKEVAKNPEGPRLNTDQNRAPASTAPAPTMGSMGPERLPAAGGGLPLIPGNTVAPPIFVPPPPTQFLPPATNTFIDNAVKNSQKSTTTIILTPNQ